jgi:hypothetical protein
MNNYQYIYLHWIDRLGIYGVGVVDAKQIVYLIISNITRRAPSWKGISIQIDEHGRICHLNRGGYSGGRGALRVIKVGTDGRLIRGCVLRHIIGNINAKIGVISCGATIHNGHCLTTNGSNIEAIGRALDNFISGTNTSKIVSVCIEHFQDCSSGRID